MTPERVAEIFAEETGDDIDASDSALRDFARRMWNEALEAAAVSAEIGTNPLGIATVADAIRALKLPEEP